jgi:hypothetical protein
MTVMSGHCATTVRPSKGLPGTFGKEWREPKDESQLLDPDAINSAVLREAPEKLNFILRLDAFYQAPELLTWLDALTEGLLRRRDFVREHPH